ncbi:pentapeptide repeat-containing protein [Actinomadura sp. 9N215]|uniref:pentapeptide repeat-containing protein n=1 Tax=Actinomadura sp. 9N215 TaxID=3375150 RepID=UPI0037A255B8
MGRLRRRAQYELAKPSARAAGVALAGFGLAVLAAAYAVALWKMPGWMSASDPRDRYYARVLVVSVGAGVVVAISLLYTARNYRLSHRGQVTDRFTKALERLSSADIDARLGGIYALAHVAADSRLHHNDVVEVLETFVRRRAPAARREDDAPTLGRPGRLPDRPEADVQAVLTALGARSHRPERRTLDLSRLHLRQARIPAADLHDVDLRGTDLRDADLVGANLVDANLVGANLRGANLRGTELVGANLRDANLVCTDLVGANLRDANLRGARLRFAHLEDANLSGARLEDANLRGARLVSARLVGAKLVGANLREANLEGAGLRGVVGQSEQEIRAVARVDERTRF